MRPKYEFAYKFTHRGDGIPCKCKEVAGKYIEVFKSSTKENPKDQELEDLRNEYNHAKDTCVVTSVFVDSSKITYMQLQQMMIVHSKISHQSCCYRLI